MKLFSLLSKPIFFILLAFFVGAQEAPVVSLQSTDSYIIRPNDMVKLDVYQEPDLASEVGVLKTGQASFPLIGSVKIAGLSVKAAASLIKGLYAKDYLRSPELTLTVSEYAVESVTVIGQVMKPGPIAIPQVGQLNLAGAIASAGGLTEMADPKNIKVIDAQGESKTYTFEEVQGEPGRRVLEVGDQVIVAESAFARSKVAVVGEVKLPRDVQIPKSGQLDLATALAIAGGPNEKADLSNIKLVKASGTTTEYSMDEILNEAAGMIRLQEGDQVVVSVSPFINATATVLGQVKRPGAVAFPIDGKMDLMTAIAMSGGFTDLANLKKINLTREGKVTEIDAKANEKKGETTWLEPNDVITVAERIF